MINYNKLAFFDFESDSADPYTTNPVQLAAAIYDPRTLDPIPGAEFNSMIRPPDFDEPDYQAKHMDTIEWHAKTLRKTVDEVLASWANAPAEKIVWEQFVTFLKQYNNNQKSFSKFSAPIAAGWNINRFDMPIIQRLCEKYGNVDKKRKEQNIFAPRDMIDGLHLAFYWFEGVADGPDAYNMDTLREYFGMTHEGAHEALSDVKACAEIITRFMKLHRKFGAKVTFRGAMINA